MYRLSKNILFHAPWLLSDKRFLELCFEWKMGYKPDLDNPRTFNEKLQWLKLHDRRTLYHTLSDKALAKEYVAGIIGKEHIIPTLGIYHSVSEIPWDTLPGKFVLKCTHDSGGLVVCRDKDTLDREKAERTLSRCLKHDFYTNFREWCYKGLQPSIICESLMEDESQRRSLTDYKFFCFGGKPEFLYISAGLEDHATASLSFFDLDGGRLPFGRSDFKALDDDFTMPENFDRMKEIASALAADLQNPFVRIDLYSIGGQIYFSEYTFYPNGGFVPFSPDKWDLKIGEMIKL